MHRKYKITGLIAAAAAVTSLALPAAAPAAAAVAPHGVIKAAATADVAGLQVAGNGLPGAYNDVRATVTAAAGSTSNAAAYLQESSTTGGYTAELALVRNTAACPGATAYQVEAGTGTVTAPGPLPTAALGAADIGGTVVCVQAGQPFYLEVHYSTLLRTAAFVAGPNEFTDTDVLGQVPAGARIFRSPALGAHYTALPALPAVSTPQIGLTRVGLTQLLQPTARRGPTNSRITFASQSLTEVFATPTGGPVTIGDRAYLEPVLPFGPGSSFGIVAAP